MAKTESIEALLNPSLRVSRPVAACARCRGAKIKCDGKLPACSACERAGKASECSSANDDFAKGKERSYVAALETTIQRLQKRLSEARSRTDNDHQGHTMSMSGLIDGRPSPQRRTVSGSRRREASDMDELVSDFGFLTVNATSRDFHGFTSNMSFGRLLLATAEKKQLPPAGGDGQMPSRYAIAPLIDHYFANIYTLLPFFSETDFMSSLAKVYQGSPSQSLVAHDHWRVRMVLAIAAASTCKAKGDSRYETAIQHISNAMKVIEHVIQPGSTSGIQALLFLVQYALVDPEHFDSWYLIGMASRLVVDLGLHCEPGPETKLSKHALDLRRRVFYCTYALDRYISMAQGFPFSFTDDSAPNVGLPTLATDLEKRSPTQLFLRSVRPSLFLFDLRRMQSAWYQVTRFSSRQEWSTVYANDYISSMLNDVRSWHASLPSTFTQAHLQYFYLEFLYSELLAVSPTQNYPTSRMTDVNKAMVVHYATQYAEQLQMALQNLESQAFVTYQDICRARAAGRQFQDVIWSDFDKLLRHQHKLVPEMLNSNATPVENCARAITFITTITNILEFARTRWGIATLRNRFEQESAVLLARLQNKQHEFNRENFQPGTTTYTTQQPGPATYGENRPPSFSFDRDPFGNMQMQQNSNDQILSDMNSAMHRSNLLRGGSWSSEQQPQQDRPVDSSQRHSYDYGGNGSGGLGSI